jgi:(E)-4-hydroxy-3-methylbut-2-enyl-diphosphate synthase
VTEAGEGEDGRIKSAVGIGTLLEDGIGDTIRVSLTEEPEAEIPVAINLVKRYNDREGHSHIQDVVENPIDPFERTKRKTHEVDRIGGNHVPVVIVTPDTNKITDTATLAEAGYLYSAETDKWNISDAAPDFIDLVKKDIDFALPGTLKKIFDYDAWIELKDKSDSIPLFSPDTYFTSKEKSDYLNLICVELSDLNKNFLSAIRNGRNIVLVLQTDNKHQPTLGPVRRTNTSGGGLRQAGAMAELRRAFIELMKNNITTPVIVFRKYKDLSDEELILYSSTDIGGLLIDGLGDGVWIYAPKSSLKTVNSISFGILQATRTRISRTEYISCPSCGRTQFDLQETTAMIRKRTDHLKGVKIAIMGCIVNGPGEMADADFGYVGSGPDKITLYKGKDVVERGIDSDVAVDKLIELIKDSGMWVEP